MQLHVRTEGCSSPRISQSESLTQGSLPLSLASSLDSGFISSKEIGVMSAPKRKREQMEWENEMEVCLEIVSIGVFVHSTPRSPGALQEAAKVKKAPSSS